MMFLTNILNPFDVLYRFDVGEIILSDRPEVLKIDEYARSLEDKIDGEFNLQAIAFEYKSNKLSYIRSGLVLAKLKFFKLYKSVGDGTFASFCRDFLETTRWSVNSNIKAARVAMELIYAGFSVLPTNISQALVLVSLTGDELIDAWRKVVENIEPHQITHKSIRSLLFAPSEKDLAVTTIKVSPTLHENIHREAAERGLSIVDFIKTMFDFFLDVENLHPLELSKNTVNYIQKERVWQADLAKLIEEGEPEIRISRSIEILGSN